jgi:hypothetical protein
MCHFTDKLGRSNHPQDPSSRLYPRPESPEAGPQPHHSPRVPRKGERKNPARMFWVSNPGTSLTRFSQTYDMYLDDGISRDSAPRSHVAQPAVASNATFGIIHKLDGIGDEKAADKYCHVSVRQVSL